MRAVPAAPAPVVAHFLRFDTGEGMVQRLDPAGHSLFAVGTASGRLASYCINQQSGALSPLAVEEVGKRPAAVPP